MSGPPMTYGGSARTVDPHSAPPLADAGWPGEPSERRRRGPLIAVASGAVVVLGVVIGVVASLQGGSSPNPHETADPSVTHTLGVTNRGAPTNVKLDDKGTSITVTWKDPTNGTVLFAVLGGPEGTEPRYLGQTEPGKTTYTQNGVNSAVDYCYFVSAIYSAAGENVSANSSVVCTHRTG